MEKGCVDGLFVLGESGVFLNKVDAFFKKNSLNYSFFPVKKGYKFHFEHKVKDVYILMKKISEEVYG